MKRITEHKLINYIKRIIKEDDDREIIEEYILNNISMGKPTKNRINEAVGVPGNIIESAIKLYDYFYAYVSSLRNIDTEDTYNIEFVGNFRISDMKVSKVNMDIIFHKTDSDNFKFLGMAQSSQVFTNSAFQVEAVVKKTVVDLMIELVTPKNFETKDLTDFLTINKEKLIPIFAHELKHGYDLFKKNTYNIYNKVNYLVLSENNFANIRPLNRFLFNSYYIHNIENLVRPTEMAAQIQLKKITPKQFYDFFIKNEIFTNLNEIKNFSYEKLKNDLMNYENQIDNVLDKVGESGDYNTIDEKVDRILDLFYINLTNWKDDRIEKFIYPIGKNDPLFRFIRTKEKDNFLKKFYKKSGKYEDDYVSFYLEEEKYQRYTAFNMIKKLGRLYELTYKNIDEPMKPNPILSENKSIWDWDLYHQIKGTNSLITNKLNVKKELLDENNLKELIKQVINDKKSPR